MTLIERVQAILLRPRQTWPEIAAETTDAAAIYRRYLVILAAIPAVAGFIGWTVFGAGMMGISIRLPLATALVQMIVGYLLTLALVYVLALIVDALAPTFGGSKNFVAALKVVAYGSTAGFVGGIFSLLPALAALQLLAALYSIYLFYTGLPVLMRCPPGKAGAYTAVVFVCAIVAGIVLGGVSSMFVGPGPMGWGSRTVVGTPATPGGDGGSVQIRTPDGATVTINPSAMAEMAKRIEEASKRMEPAQSPGAGASAGMAVGDAAGAVGNVEPIAAAELKAMLPESIGEWKRTAIEAQSGEAMGFTGSAAKASYSAGDRRAELAITDTAGLAGLATMAAAWANMRVDQDADGKVEKVYRDGTRTFHEEYHKDASHGELAVILANGVIVSAEGRKVDIASLKSLLQGVDLAKLEATKRVARR
ncbi:MAG TPA: Yip1 family protein [Caldimonas sp.]|nr:Yip1 family protein [Caldimonas sp.]HEX4233488.1 Yip1 family protein [Caldimonas sp.]